MFTDEKWLSVDEVLPKDGEEILVYVKAKGFRLDFQEVVYYELGRFYKNRYQFVDRVTHWTHLPPKPGFAE